MSYLNTKPLLYGLQQGSIQDQIVLSVDFPSRIAEQLKNGEVDLALIPVAVIPQLKDYHIVSDYCIGAEGPVASVCLFSDVPLQEIERVYLDYQSLTSVALTKVLAKAYWRISPQWIDTREEYQSLIQGANAGLVIGDRALQQRKRSKYIYDLAEAWLAYAGLPFVFAAWVSNQLLPADFIRAFNAANETGLQHLDAVIAANPCDFFDLHAYYTRHISYLLTSQKRRGLAKFLSLLSEASPIISPSVP